MLRKSIRWWLKIVVFVVLAGLTAGTALRLERYPDQGPELLINNGFVDGLDGWQLQGNGAGMELLPDGVLRLTGQGAGQQMAVNQTLTSVQPGQKIRLRGELRSEDIRRGAKPWYHGRLVLASFDKEGGWLPVSHVACSLEGSNDWQPCSAIFTLSAETASVKVLVELNQTTGVFQARDLSLHRVIEAPWYPWLKGVIVGLWLLFGVVLFIPAYFPSTLAINKRMVALVALVIALVLLGTALPGSLKSQASKDIDSRVKIVTDLMVTTQAGQALAAWPPVSTLASRLPDKGNCAHFGLFALLAALTLFYLPSKSWLTLTVDLCILAGATELIQFYVDDRSPLWTDMALDLSGAAIGILLVSALYFLKGKRLKALG